MNDEARKLRMARPWIRQLVVHCPSVEAWVITTLEDAVDEALARLTERPVIVFKPVCRLYGAETWAIHRADQPERVYPYNDIGLSAAWLAIQDQCLTDTVRAGDFAKPGAARADTVVRTAIRITALDWVERETGCAELAAALRAIKVEGGRVRYRPGKAAPRFDTGQ